MMEQKRKREKLDHLSEEEKSVRRKLKNRISAQRSRDRKKEKLSDMQAEADSLAAEKRLLLERLESVRLRNEHLKFENRRLRRSLVSTNIEPEIRQEIQDSDSFIIEETIELETAEPSETVVSTVAEAGMDSIGSAESINDTQLKHQETEDTSNGSKVLISPTWTKLLIL